MKVCQMTDLLANNIRTPNYTHVGQRSREWRLRTRVRHSEYTVGERTAAEERPEMVHTSPHHITFITSYYKTVDFALEYILNCGDSQIG